MLGLKLNHISKRGLMCVFNSLRSGYIYMRGSSLVQVMARRLFGAKPLPEPILTICQFDPWWYLSQKTDAFFQESIFTDIFGKNPSQFPGTDGIESVSRQCQQVWYIVSVFGTIWASWLWLHIKPPEHRPLKSLGPRPLTSIARFGSPMKSNESCLISCTI